MKEYYLKIKERKTQNDISGVYELINNKGKKKHLFSNQHGKDIFITKEELEKAQSEYIII